MIRGMICRSWGGQRERERERGKEEEREREKREKRGGWEGKNNREMRRERNKSQREKNWEEKREREEKWEEKRERKEKEIIALRQEELRVEPRPLRPAPWTAIRSVARGPWGCEGPEIECITITRIVAGLAESNNWGAPLIQWPEWVVLCNRLNAEDELKGRLSYVRVWTTGGSARGVLVTISAGIIDQPIFTLWISSQILCRGGKTVLSPGSVVRSVLPLKKHGGKGPSEPGRLGGAGVRGQPPWRFWSRVQHLEKVLSGAPLWRLEWLEAPPPGQHPDNGRGRRDGVWPALCTPNTIRAAFVIIGFILLSLVRLRFYILSLSFVLVLYCHLSVVLPRWTWPGGGGRVSPACRRRWSLGSMHCLHLIALSLNPAGARIELSR